MKKSLIPIAVALLGGAALTAVVHTQLRSEPPDAPNFAGVQFTPFENGWWFFDTHTGDIWIYDKQRKLPLWHYRLRSLGGQIEQVPNPKAETSQGAKPRP